MPITHDILKQIRANQVKSLDLRNLSLGDKDIAVLADALQVNSSLETLDLSSNQIGLNGIQTLCTSLESHSSLKSLKLEKNYLNNNTAGLLIAEMLTKNNSLESVDLIGYSNIQPQTLEQINKLLVANIKKRPKTDIQPVATISSVVSSASVDANLEVAKKTAGKLVGFCNISKDIISAAKAVVSNNTVQELLTNKELCKGHREYLQKVIEIYQRLANCEPIRPGILTASKEATDSDLLIENINDFAQNLSKQINAGQYYENLIKPCQFIGQNAEIIRTVLTPFLTVQDTGRENLNQAITLPIRQLISWKDMAIDLQKISNEMPEIIKLSQQLISVADLVGNSALMPAEQLEQLHLNSKESFNHSIHDLLLKTTAELQENLLKNTDPSQGIARAKLKFGDKIINNSEEFSAALATICTNEDPATEQLKRFCNALSLAVSKLSTQRASGLLGKGLDALGGNHTLNQIKPALQRLIIEVNEELVKIKKADPTFDLPLLELRENKLIHIDDLIEKMQKFDTAPTLNPNHPS